MNMELIFLFFADYPILGNEKSLPLYLQNMGHHHCQDHLIRPEGYHYDQILYCTKGSGAPDGKTVLCPKKGVMQKDSSCSAFRYDPLKRKPKQPVELPQFDASDFEL